MIDSLVFVELDKYVELQEKRLSEQIQKEYVGIVAKKVRVCGPPSSCKPPESAPPWAIKKNSEGKCEFHNSDTINYWIILFKVV